LFIADIHFLKPLSFSVNLQACALPLTNSLDHIKPLVNRPESPTFNYSQKIPEAIASGILVV